jgi:hypothetical protein
VLLVSAVGCGFFGCVAHAASGRADANPLNGPMNGSEGAVKDRSSVHNTRVQARA